MNLLIAWILIRPIRRIREVRQIRRTLKLFKTVKVETMNLSALKSKTVWFGIAQLVFSAATAIITGGPTEPTVITLVTGVTTIILRAVTNQPLSAK